MSRNLKYRLAKLEDVTSEDDLAEMYRWDAPILFGSEEHKAALADPVKYHLAERSIFEADEPGPEHPIL